MGLLHATEGLRLGGSHANHVPPRAAGDHELISFVPFVSFVLFVLFSA